MSKIAQLYQMPERVTRPLDILSVLLAVALVILVDASPIEQAIFVFSNVQIRLEVFSLFIAGVTLFALRRYLGNLLDFQNIYVALFICFLVLSSEWSLSERVAGIFMMDALTIIPLSYALGLCMARCNPIHVCIMYIFVAIPSYFYFIPDFSIYGEQVDIFVSYQGAAQCYWLAAIGAVICAVHFQRPVIRLGFFATAFFFAAAMLNSGGRGGIIPLGGAIAAMLICEYPKRRAIIIMSIISISVIANWLIDFMFFELYEFAKENRIFSLERQLGSYINPTEALIGRDFLAIRALEVSRENLLFGVGLGGFPITTGGGDDPGLYPHSVVLEVLAEQGLFGLLLFCGMIFFFVSRYLRVQSLLPRTQRFYIVAFATAFSAQALTSAHTETDVGAWMIAGHVIGLSWEYTGSHLRK